MAVTTHHNDLNRTGAYTNETTLDNTNVDVSTFGKLFARAVDGQIYAQPLYVPGVTLPGQGVHNVVYVCTEHNSVYAFDAEDPNASDPLWQVNLGIPLPASVIGSTRDLLPEIGITGTPVIEQGSNTLFVVAETYQNGQATFRLHALDITTGAEKFNGPTVIQGSVPGTGVGSTNGVLAFNPIMHWQRPGLLLWNGNIYIGFGGHQDTEPYHGWMFAYSTTTLQQTAIRCLSPNSSASGVWQSGVGLAVDASNGFIFMYTGQGPLDANTGGTSYGDSIVKLDTNNGMAVVDYFAPSDAAALDSADLDLGAGAPILIPGTSLGVGGGKSGKMFLWNRNNLGQFDINGDHVVQEWQATPISFFAGNVFYNSTLYAWGRGDFLKAYAFNGATFNTTPTRGTILLPDGYSNEPAMSLSADGTTPGTGILWAAYSANGASNGLAYPGILRALDAANVSNELWNSNQNQSRDYSGSWAKWCPPTIANGRVYLGTFDNILNVYGLLPPPGSGRLLGSGNSSTTTSNLTTEGAADWVHWGDDTLNRKAGVTAQLSSYTVVGAGGVTVYNDDPRPISWSDGSPLGSSTSNQNGVFINGVGLGFSITAPADTSTRTLVVHVGGWNSGGKLTAHLSDGSALDYADTTATATDQYDRNYTLTYNAGSVGQTLTVTWKMASGTGNVTVNAAALSNGAAQTPSSVTASAGTPQSAKVNAAFATALKATVKDAGNNPMSGITVTFTAPGSGPSGTFSGSASVATNASGVATAPAFTANSQVGSYTVTARVSGVATAANFNLTNTTGTPASVTASAGTPQSAAVNTTFAAALKATVKDAGNNPVSGVTVTFTAPGGGASGTFSGSASVATNASGVATAPTFTANGQAGSYLVTARVTGVSTLANFSLTNSAVVSGGSLAGSGISSSGLVNLTTEGSADWVHWGDGTLVRKDGVTAQLSSYTVVGVGGVTPYNNDPRPISWSDGDSLDSYTNNQNGLFISGVGQGFSITAPADTSTRKLVVHVGGWNSGGQLTAHLSDSSDADFTDTTVTANGQYDRNYTLIYNAASAGQSLKVTWTMVSGTGNVTVNAAALVGGATQTSPSVTASAGTPQSATVNTAFATALKATVKDAGNNPMSGVMVTFTAPGSGPSGTFGGSASVATNASGVATAPTFTANGQAGSYTVTASVVGVATPASFKLTNNAVVASGSLAGSGTSSSGLVNLTTEGSADWVNWGDGTLIRKDGVAAQLSSYTVVGMGGVTPYNNDPRPISWSDGSPLDSNTNNQNGLFISGVGQGFSITAPASTTTRTLVVHVGGWNSGGKLTAHLSDGSDGDYTDTTVTANGQYDRNYTLIYNAASAGQTLKVTWTMASGTGNVTLDAAALR